MKLIFLVLITFGSIIFIYELWEDFSGRDEPDYKMVKGEHFNSSLSKLTSVAKFTTYCDSTYGATKINPLDTEKYATIVSSVVRDRFYHGYSYYSLGQNTVGYLLAPLIKADLRAIVIPDDILKHPMAACSQQSIIGMEVFKMKGFAVRKVGFFSKGVGGHFCFEAFFYGKWHFFDPDMEPKLSVMVANHFPGISELAQNDSLLHILYYKENEEVIKKLFITYTYGPVNKFPAPRARVYQYLTKYLSYTSWLLFILLYWVVRKKLIYSKKKEVCVELPDSLAPEIRA